MRVELIAWTAFQLPASLEELWTGDRPFSFEDDHSYVMTEMDESYIPGQQLIEMAGRVCYQSWNRPNPATATNTGYVQSLIQKNHLSVLEHASATFYITGISRSCSHELVRHRHLSISQLSQRYVDESSAIFITPDIILNSPYVPEAPINAHTWFEQPVMEARHCYTKLVAEIIKYLEKTQPDMTALERRKAARQAARAVLPNATETQLVVTGNYRAWRHIIEMRNSDQADPEIHKLARHILEHLQILAPAVFGEL